MSFNVQFGTVYKRHNSTFRGASGSHWLTLAVSLKESCSVTQPSFFVDVTENEIFSGGTLNHCYVALFDRYYFVDNWTYERGHWRADCSIDVLASWRSSIGSSSQYVLRSASASDGTIFDSMYPVKNDITVTYSNDNNPWSVYGGYYIIGLISGQSAGLGGITYYALTESQFEAFMAYLFGSITTYFDMTEVAKDITEETFKALYNPFQYVASVMYLPLSMAGQGLRQETIKFGYWSLSCYGGRMTSLTPIQKTVSISWAGAHPNASRGNYVYCNPYTRIDMDFPPFGHFQLPSDIVRERGFILCEVDIDVITGKGTCYIGGKVMPFMTVEAQVGVPISISQMSTDYLGIATSVTQGVASTMGSIAKGDFAGAIVNGVSGIDSAIRSQVPTLSTTGSNGGFSSLTQPPTAIFTYYSIVDEDRDRLGRPLCKQRTINTLSGYILCENAAVETGGTFEENQEISRLMNSGFYYE